MQAESLKAIEICPTGSESPSAAEPEKQKKTQKIPLAFSYLMRSNILKEWKAELEPSF